MVDIATEKKSTAWGKILSEHRTPQAIAAGASFGIVLGLIPKDNLVALGLLIAIAFLPVHHLIACTFALLGLLLSPWTDPWVHSVGKQFLSIPLAGSLISKLYQWPLVPWMRLENTLVAGGLIVGLFLWIPHYLIAKRLLLRATKTELGLEFIELAAANVRRRKKFISSPLEASDAIPSFTPLQETAATEIKMRPVHEGISISDIEPTASSETLSQADYAAAATSHNVDSELLAEIGQERVLHETFIEVVRYKRPRSMDESDPHTEDSHLHSQFSTNSMNLVASLAARTDSNANRMAETNMLRSDSGHPLQSDAAPKLKTHVVNHPGTKEEALRHILKHIHGSRDARKEPEKTA
ncbi:TIGR03546 family protein [Pirellulaceae bacterium SH501]